MNAHLYFAARATHTPRPRPPSFVQRRATVITESFRNHNGGATTIAILLPPMGKNVPVILKTVKMDVLRLFSVSSILAAAPELLNVLARKLSAENEHFDHTSFSEMAACGACSKFSICVHELRFDKCAACELTFSCDYDSALSTCRSPRRPMRTCPLRCSRRCYVQAERAS